MPLGKVFSTIEIQSSLLQRVFVTFKQIKTINEERVNIFINEKYHRNINHDAIAIEIKSSII